MTNTQAKLLDDREFNDNGALVNQLNREISCLQRQLDRLKLLDGNLDGRTLETYQEMISSRRKMLSEMSF